MRLMNSFTQSHIQKIVTTMIGGKSSLINATWKMGGGEPAQLCRKTKLQVPHKVNYRCSAITVSSFI